MKEFYDNANKRADLVIDELSKLGTIARRRSYEEMKYEEGDVGGG